MCSVVAFSCLLPVGVGSVLAASHTMHAAGDFATELPPISTKIRDWPVLNEWIRGQRIDREPTMTPGYPEADLARYGAGVYSLYCVNCHGTQGRGDGPRAPVFKPPPRDFTRAKFKFRSTPTGELPTSEDLFRTISGGLHGTGMPAFADLPELDRWALVAHLRTLSPEFSRGGPVAPVPIPAAPHDLASRVSRGCSPSAEFGPPEPVA